MEKLKWVREHGGAWFATFWIVLALYALGGYLVWAFLQLDAQFSRPLAGGVIPADVTQQVAWGTRMFSVIAGAMAIYFNLNDMKRWSAVFTVMTIVAALILLLHAYGVAAKIMQKQYDNDAAITQVATVNTDAIAQQIEDLQQERADLRSDTQLTVNTLQRSIDNVTTDGLDNDELADAYRADQAAALRARDTRLAEISGAIEGLRTEARGVSSTATQEVARSDSFNPLFTFLARLSTGVWDPAQDPSNVHKFAWGIAFFTLFFGFGEILMMISFTGGYAALKVVSERKKRSDAARKGWQTKKSEPKAKKRDPITIEDKGYWRDNIARALAGRMPARTPTGMMNTYFSQYADVPTLRYALRAQMRDGLIVEDSRKDKDNPIVGPFNQDQLDWILCEGIYAAPLPEKPKQHTNGVDHSELPPEDSSDADDTRPSSLPAS